VIALLPIIESSRTRCVSPNQILQKKPVSGKRKEVGSSRKGVGEKMDTVAYRKVATKSRTGGGGGGTGASRKKLLEKGSSYWIGS